MRRLVCRVALLAGGVTCSSVDLYPVTTQPNAPVGGTSGSGGASGGASGGVAGGMTGGATGGMTGGVGGGMTGGATGSMTGGATGGMTGGASGGGAAAPACPDELAAAGDSTQTLSVNGVTRTYLLHVPAVQDRTRRVPLVLDFHALGSSALSERSSSPYPGVLDPEGVIMAFPEGLRGPAGSAWNVGPCCVADVDDVAFARAVVAHVETLACIDAARVYAVGVLTGGGMAHYLACHAADLFAAVAPAAFDLLAENADECAPQRPVSSIAFRGDGESRVPYEGGPSSLVPGMPITFLGAQGTFEKWSDINGCRGPMSAPDTNGCSAYSDCQAGVEVVLCTKQGGREEPGDPEIAWPFLRRHVLD